MIITDISQLGQTIRTKRKKLAYTQAFLAAATGLSISFISDAENGKQTAEIGKLLSLLHYLGLDLSIIERGA